MIEAFEAGGDFHSRTAVGMYPYIKEKVGWAAALSPPACCVDSHWHAD